MSPVLEVCCGSYASALAAQEGGAHRVELCNNLYEGGTTPSHGTLSLAREKLTIKINVLVRPRGSDFVYSDDEMEIIRRDVIMCKELGIDGVVIGFLTPRGEIDVDKTTEIVRLARPMSVTFHRAFDMCKDPYWALEELIHVGIDRVLTSGQKNMAPEGIDLIAELVKKAGDRVIIMPGAGLEPENIAGFHAKVGAKEYHSTLWDKVESKMKYRQKAVFMGGLAEIPEFSWMQTSVVKVKQFIKELE
ncbi:MAG: copper homeostasis protein CutC [Candidatus Bathyarchaeota archaeon]